MIRPTRAPRAAAGYRSRVVKLRPVILPNGRSDERSPRPEPGPTDRRGAPDSEQLLTALSTEHFNVFAVSSALVALGFIGQLSDVSDHFHAFALTVLPTLYLLGIVTFIRLVECGAEDFRYGLAINRIRHYYEEVAGDRADLFLLSGHDDGAGVFANMGLPAEGRKPYFAFSSAILVINSVLGGAAVTFAAGAFLDPSLAVAVAVGIAAAIVSVVAWIRYADRLLDSAAQTEPLFPSPARGGADRPAD